MRSALVEIQSRAVLTDVLESRQFTLCRRLLQHWEQVRGADPDAGGDANTGTNWTSEPQPLYLPIALREECVRGRHAVDVVLALDTSGYM